MGIDGIKAIGITDSAKKNIEQSYDAVHGSSPEPSIWENFSPLMLTSTALFPILFKSKDVKSIPLDKTLSGRNARLNKSRIIYLNELSARTDALKIKDPFLNADLNTINANISKAQKAGKITKAELKALNKKYFELLEKSSTWKFSPLQKTLAKCAVKSPNILGRFTKSFISNKFMFLVEAVQEVESVMNAFNNSTDSGMRQLAKSTGRAVVGYSGFAAGAAAGGKIGALLGSVIPGAGTFVGGLLGTVIGFSIGGVFSHLAKAGYDKVVTSEAQSAKEKTLSTILSSTDNSEEGKNMLRKEIQSYIEYLNQAEDIVAQLREYDAEKAANIQSQMVVVNNALQELSKLYREKYGEDVIGMAAPAATNTTSASNNSTAAVAAQQNPLSSAYNLTGVTGNEFMNYTPQQDWASMLPAGTYNRLFNVTA